MKKESLKKCYVLMVMELICILSDTLSSFQLLKSWYHWCTWRESNIELKVTWNSIKNKSFRLKQRFKHTQPLSKKLLLKLKKSYSVESYFTNNKKKIIQVFGF